jgi:hypothetical protein
MPHPLLVPDILVRHVSDAPASLLQTRGVRAVVTDLDNTLIGWHKDEATEEVLAWLAGLREAGIGVCIASNTRRLPRLARVAGVLGVHYVPQTANKPGTSGLRHALHLLNTSPSEAAMVGDQLFTDIVAGNRLGMTTVLVNPLERREFIGTRLISRNMERLVLRGSLRRAR